MRKLGSDPILFYPIDKFYSSNYFCYFFGAMQLFLGFSLKTLWQLVQYIGGLMHPASLPASIVVNLSQGFPESQSTVTNG